MDFAVLLPALINLGPWGVAIVLALYLRNEHAKELKEKDETISKLQERNDRGAADRLADHKAMLEVSVNREREMTRVTTESTNATTRVTGALETVTDTLRDVANNAQIERELRARGPST